MDSRIVELWGTGIREASELVGLVAIGLVGRPVGFGLVWSSIVIGLVWFGLYLLVLLV